MFQVWPTTTVAVLFFYHIFFCNLLLAFYQCVMTDPGVVPPNWGFYMGDETKRRRYCKMCNVWKPDRTHHCSICNRCILNMDHHCPWINNCVGFYNRKFFIQLLSYVFLSLCVVVVCTIPELIFIFLALTGKSENSAQVVGMWYCITSGIVGFAWCMSVLLIVTLTNFIKFHLKLVLENYTTIENLEREEGAKSKFDIGRTRNWEQVFGSNRLMWWLPMHTQASRPIGDGVRWRVHYTRVIDEDEELPADDGTSQASRLLQQGSQGSTSRTNN
jgi:palmitoyltransferase